MRKISWTTRCSSLAKRLAGVLDVGVGHRGVLAHDVHPPDLAAVDRVHDLDDRQARLGVERRAPEVLEDAPRTGVVDRAIVGVDHRDQAGVGRPLDVVLAAERVQARPGPADLAGQSRARAIRQRALSVPWTCCEIPIPQKIIAARAVAYSPGDLAERRRRRSRRSAPSPRARSPRPAPRSVLEALA